MAAEQPVPLNQMSAPMFFHTYTTQHAALDSFARRRANVFERLFWANDKYQLRSVLYEYAVAQFNSRFDRTYDIVKAEMPKANIFARSVRTRQRIAAQLARESELAATQIRAWSTGKPLDPAFLPNLDAAIAHYRRHLAGFIAKPLDWINQAAHKLH